MQTNQHLHESQEPLRPHIHKCVINYSCLSTYCRAFTSTFYEKIMHFNEHLFVCLACLVDTKCVYLHACVCVFVYVCLNEKGRVSTQI